MSDRTLIHSKAQELLVLLRLAGIEAYIYNKAKTGSVYIRFKDARIGSIRVGDHEGRQKYSYKYNLRLDIDKTYTKKDGKVERYFYPPTKLRLMAKAIQLRAQAVKKFPTISYDKRAAFFKKPAPKPATTSSSYMDDWNPRYGLGYDPASMGRTIICQ
jgi:hypothetical protein